MEVARLPCGPVYSPQQALDDAHIQTVGFLQDVAYPGLPTPAPIADFPVSLSASPGRIRHRAPTLGEHTDAVLTSLGYTLSELAKLREKRVI
jgi:crotonobetainyl-CoA:carnitine CoA-transferase CaiB-like acyl-CoA transferase